jgi:AraC-like DNA-binding protein
MEAMFVNRTSSVQIAESGTFFAQRLSLPCSSPLLGSACADLGINTTAPITVQVGRRNVEGGPRRTDNENTTYRIAFELSLRAFEAPAQRCPGRGLPQKLQVLRRLMRVRQLMLLQCNQPLCIDQMAAHASYSRAHFLHIYRLVFTQTPHAHLLEHRLNLAQHLLSDRGYRSMKPRWPQALRIVRPFLSCFIAIFGRTAVSMRPRQAA